MECGPVLQRQASGKNKPLLSLETLMEDTGLHKCHFQNTRVYLSCAISHRNLSRIFAFSSRMHQNLVLLSCVTAGRVLYFISGFLDLPCGRQCVSLYSFPISFLVADRTELQPWLCRY